MSLSTSIFSLAEIRSAMAVVMRALTVTCAAHILALAGAAMVIVWCTKYRGGLAWDSTNKSLIFNIHPVLMLVGFIIPGGEAIMIYKSVPLRREVKKLIHLVLHAIALVLGIVGIVTAFKFHNESGIANLYSLHSWLGIFVISVYSIQWVYGLVVLFFIRGGTVGFREGSMEWHRLVGRGCFIIAVGNACIGFLEKLTFLEAAALNKYSSEALLVNSTAILVILFAFSVVLSSRSNPPSPHHSIYSPL